MEACNQETGELNRNNQTIEIKLQERCDKKEVGGLCEKRNDCKASS